MSAGLRAARSDLQTRSASTREGCCEKEHPSQGIARSLAPATADIAMKVAKK